MVMLEINEMTRELEDQIIRCCVGSPMAASDRALNGSGQARGNPVAGKVEAFDGGLRDRALRLPRRKREGRSRLPNDRGPEQLAGTGTGNGLKQLLDGEEDQERAAGGQLPRKVGVELDDRPDLLAGGAQLDLERLDEGLRGAGERGRTSR